MIVHVISFAFPLFVLHISVVYIFFPFFHCLHLSPMFPLFSFVLFGGLACFQFPDKNNIPKFFWSPFTGTVCQNCLESIWPQILFGCHVVHGWENGESKQNKTKNNTQFEGDFGTLS